MDLWRERLTWMCLGVAIGSAGALGILAAVGALH